jgi:hypothetical protein
LEVERKVELYGFVSYLSERTTATCGREKGAPTEETRRAREMVCCAFVMATTVGFVTELGVAIKFYSKLAVAKWVIVKGAWWFSLS